MFSSSTCLPSSAVGSSVEAGAGAGAGAASSVAAAGVASGASVVALVSSSDMLVRLFLGGLGFRVVPVCCLVLIESGWTMWLVFVGSLFLSVVVLKVVWWWGAASMDRDD